MMSIKATIFAIKFKFAHIFSLAKSYFKYSTADRLVKTAAALWVKSKRNHDYAIYSNILSITLGQSFGEYAHCVKCPPVMK